jgi:hypothetical protein
MEKSPQDDCVGSVPFDYSLLEDSGRPPDAGSAKERKNLKKEPELALHSRTPVPKKDKTTIELITRAHAPENDAILPDSCKGLLNRKAVRLTALEWINERFSHNGKERFTRVSEKFIDQLEHMVEAELLRAIQRHPSPLAGSTVRDYTWTQSTTPNSPTPSSAPPP